MDPLFLSYRSRTVWSESRQIEMISVIGNDQENQLSIRICLSSDTDNSQASIIFIQVIASSRVDNGSSPCPMTLSRKCLPVSLIVYGYAE